MAAYRSSSKNTQILNLESILNKNSLWAHTESELDMLGIAGKLVKYSFHPKLLYTFNKSPFWTGFGKFWQLWANLDRI
jgi:hypothetical protein